MAQFDSVRFHPPCSGSDRLTTLAPRLILSRRHRLERSNSMAATSSNAMSTDLAPTISPPPVAPDQWFESDRCSFEAFVELVESPNDEAHMASARRFDRGVPVYAAADVIGADEGSVEARRALLSELAWVFQHGPGVAVFEGVLSADAIDRGSEVFWDLIERERSEGKTRADHFAAAGANDRVWNALEKMAIVAPDAFASYYSCRTLAFVSEAWLGPNYQVTSQINVVNPGGAAQSPHRDYHLGFMTDDEASAYPAHVHSLSPALTLQGAIAHCDMPVETGPTMYLPNSQRFGAGYLAWRRDDFAGYFDEHYVQLPLSKGDAVFFNPALFHGAGTNTTTDVRRMGNLLQVSSAFGRAMERIDRRAMSLAVYPSLVARKAAGAVDAELHTVVAACAEGYAFPGNLDDEPPVNGLAPEADAALMRHGLDAGWSVDQLAAAFAARSGA